ncbi:MAG: hypothetical protein LJE84_02475 [Gammaproteobacteria bacterium]|nr:hypothetical protein [Gammaproteobacteria bacterium]
MKRLIAIATILLLASGTALAQQTPQSQPQKKKPEPASMGAHFGDLRTAWPNFVLVASRPEGDVGRITKRDLARDKNLNRVQYIRNTRQQQINTLLTLARQLATQVGARHFALANIRYNTQVTIDEIVVETWGDLVAANLPPTGKK